MGGGFNALFAAAEASIDRLAEEKRTKDDGEEPGPGVAARVVAPVDDAAVEISTADGEDTEDPDVTTDADGDGGDDEEASPASPPRRLVNPIHRRSAARPMPSRKTPRAAESPAPKPGANSANAAVTQSLIKARNEMTELLEAAGKANQGLKDEKQKLEQRVAKLKANQETGRQRAAREREDAVTRARDKVLKEFLPVVDNLERAVSVEMGELSGDAATKVEGYRTGVENVLRLFVSALKKMNVEGYTALGEIFDPSVHEAIRRLEDPSKPANTVVEEYQKGYLIDGRLLRPAVVVVSTGGPKQAD